MNHIHCFPTFSFTFRKLELLQKCFLFIQSLSVLWYLLIEESYRTILNSSGNSEVPLYTMISGSEYTVNPTAKYLVFLEAGDDYWQLQSQNETASSISIFNYASLFTISQPGGQYTLSYLGLGYLEQGVLVAVFGAVLIVVVLKFAYPKRLIQRKPEK